MCHKSVGINNSDERINIKLNKDGQLYYYGKEFEIVKYGDKEWDYKIYLDGKEIKGVISVEFKLQVGEVPIIHFDICDC